MSRWVCLSIGPIILLAGLGYWKQVPLSKLPETSKGTYTTLKFDFGSGRVAAGCIPISSSTIYTEELGYGFEPGASITCQQRAGQDELRNDFCSSNKPFFFSVSLPEGNYNVTLTFGDHLGETVTTVKAELRRLMLEEVRTPKGKFATETFTVNVRRPQISTGGEVKLKDREKTTEVWAWDEKLTLEFNNSRPTINALEITRGDHVPTLFLLGDSTVNNYGSYQLAQCIVESIRVQDLGLKKYLEEDVSAFDPGRPDNVKSFRLPPSPLIAEVKPLGN